MGRIMLATSASTDEEYGGNIAPSFDSETFDFSTPSGVNYGGKVYMTKCDNIVILRFVDYYPKCDTTLIELFSGIASAKYQMSALIFTTGDNASNFKILLSGNKVYSYYNADTTSSTKRFSGQIVYITE